MTRNVKHLDKEQRHCCTHRRQSTRNLQMFSGYIPTLPLFHSEQNDLFSQIAFQWNVKPCGPIVGRSLSSASYRGVPVSIPNKYMWNLWWTKWRWQRFCSQYCGFLPSVSFHQSCISVLLSVERQTAEAWETFRHSHAVADIGEALNSNALFLMEE